MEGVWVGVGAGQGWRQGGKEEGMGRGWDGQPRAVALLEATSARPGDHAGGQASAEGLTPAGTRHWLPGGQGRPKEKCGEGGGSGGNGRAAPGFGQRLPYKSLFFVGLARRGLQTYCHVNYF